MQHSLPHSLYTRTRTCTCTSKTQLNWWKPLSCLGAHRVSVVAAVAAPKRKDISLPQPHVSLLTHLCIWFQLRGFPEGWKERGKESDDCHHRRGVPRQPRPGEGDPAKREGQRDQICCGRKSCPGPETLDPLRGSGLTHPPTQTPTLRV